MRIAFVDPEPPSPSGGGIRTYTRLVVELCRRRGFETCIYTHNPDSYPGLEVRAIGRTRILPRGLRALAYRFLHAETMAFEHSRWLSDEFRKETFELIEIPDFQGYGFFPVQDPDLQKRIALRVHTPLHLVYGEEGRYGISFQVLRFREVRCLRRAVHISVPSEEFIQEKIPWLKSHVAIPNPPPAIVRGNPWVSPNDRGGDKSAFLFLGRLEPRKGVRELLQAFLILAREFPTITLNFVAGGKAAKESIHHRIKWLPPHQGDKTPLMRSYDCLIIPSLWENCPYVFWEGMAAGIPCLGTETGEMKKARRTTLAPEIPPGNIEALIKAMRSIIQKPDPELLARQHTYLESVAVAAESLTDWYLQCAQPGW